MKKITTITLLLSSIFITSISSLSAAELEAIKLDPIQESLKEIKLNKVKLEELFYNNHAGTDYSPIKLEARIDQPVALNLADLLSKAVEDNLNLNIARADSDIAKWIFWSKFSNALPDVSLGFGTQNRDGTFYLNSNFQAAIDENIATANMRISYRAFDGGTTSFLAWAEKLYADSSKENVKAQYNKTLLDAISFYMELVKNQVSLATNLKALERAKVNLDLSNKFFKAGTGTKYDVMQAEAVLARAQQKLIQEEADFRISQMNIAELLNEPLLTPYKIDGKTVKTFNYINDELEIEDFIESAKDNNPSIQAVLKAKKGAYKEGLAKAGDFLPKVDIFADFTGTGEELDDLFSITTLGFNTSYEIGSGLGLSPVANAMESKNRVKKAKLEYRQQLQSIEKQLRTSFINYQRSKSLVDASHKEYLAAKEALRLSKLRYENGLEVFANLIDREASMTEAELNMIQAIADFNLSQVQLAYDMGTINAEDILASENG